MPVPLWAALTLLRELLRALMFPVRVVLYYPRRHHWNQRAREALATREATDAGGGLEEFMRLRRPRSAATPHVFLSAGEASGETHAVNVMRAVAAGGVQARWSSFGGTRMQAEGAELLAQLTEHPIMGVSGVMRALPFVVGSVIRYLKLLRDDPPDLVVLVDYPGLHTILGRLARLHGIPVLHYIAPQYWAWAPWRMRRYRHCMDASLTILPFEAHFYRREGLATNYVGHPILDHLAAHPPDAGAVEEVRARPTLCMLPGSRSSEIVTNLPPLVRIARSLRQDHPDLRFVIAHVDEDKAELIRSILDRENGDLIELHLGPLAPWLVGARAVLAKSGTGSLEACLHGAPTVIYYRMKGWFASWFYRNYITVPWIGAANLIAGRLVAPEIVFRGDDGWRRVEQAARSLLRDGPERTACLEGLEQVRQRMGPPGASERAAGWVLEFLADGDG